MAMPYMEGHGSDQNRWLASLVQRALQSPGSARKTVFELQSVDWRKPNQAISSTELAREMQTIRLAGGDSFGYYPDDFPAGLPALDVVESMLSARSFPGSN
jgi:biofilm PGA synthesis lipoprotein PgaB